MHPLRILRVEGRKEGSKDVFSSSLKAGIYLFIVSGVFRTSNIHLTLQATFKRRKRTAKKNLQPVLIHLSQ